MARFRKKPVVIEAVQITATTKPEDVPGWLKAATGKDRNEVGALWGTDLSGPALMVNTLEGPLRVSENDWIIRGVEGELYPCKDSIFRATYEPAD